MDRRRAAGLLRALAARGLVPLGASCITLGAVLAHDALSLALAWAGLAALAAWLGVIARR